MKTWSAHYPTFVMEYAADTLPAAAISAPNDVDEEANPSLNATHPLKEQRGHSDHNIALESVKSWNLPFATAFKHRYALGRGGLQESPPSVPFLSLPSREKLAGEHSKQIAAY